MASRDSLIILLSLVVLSGCMPPKQAAVGNWRPVQTDTKAGDGSAQSTATEDATSTSVVGGEGDTHTTVNSPSLMKWALLVTALSYPVGKTINRLPWLILFLAKRTIPRRSRQS